MRPALGFERVTVRMGESNVLAEVSLEVPEGEIVALLGPSGSGKTTLVRLALGLLAPESGSVSIQGECASANGRILIPPEARRLAVVFQDLALWPHLTVHGNLAFALRARGVDRADARTHIRAMLRRVGLEGTEERYPGTLSGGERQRVAIARALVVEPRAVLLDEPLANLDVGLKRELLELFVHLLREQWVATLYVTHDPREASRLAAHWTILEAGRITQAASFPELRSQPATPFIAALLDELGSA